MKPEPQYSSTRRKIFDLHPKNLFLSLGMVFVIALSVMGSLLFGRFIDLLITKQSFDTATQLHLVALLATLLAAAILNVFLSQYLPLKVQLSRSIDKVNEVMSALMRVPYKFYSQNEKGYYINLITSSAFTYGDLYGHINIQLIANGICVALILGVSYLIHPVFLGVYIAYIPLYALLSHKPNNAIANFQKVGLPTQDKFLSATKKNTEEKKSINLAKAEEYFLRMYDAKSHKYLEFVQKYKFFSILASNIPTLLSNVLIVLVMSIGTFLFFKGDVTIGTILIVFQLSQILQNPLNRIFEISIHYAINRPHLERIGSFIDLADQESGFESFYGDREHLLSIAKGSFYATPDKERLLFSVDELTLEKNQLVVIKGGNGSGKSTILNYITSFADPAQFEGNMELDNSLRDVAYLSYPILVTDGSVAENLFGKEVDENLFGVLRVDFRDKVITESPVNLSFGEQQKLNLLRILSLDSHVLMLDEPFSNLDQKTTEELVHYIAKIKGQKSIFVIAHSDELDAITDVVLTIRDRELHVLRHRQ